ncbi:dsRBD fold-containing protein [Ornithinimicrobium pekingense]|uniref:DUF1918 domain-containing protein n=1 Tax=Ornithinimicrobium pekingense TaxID=384677 RepID=A0ABQ2FEM9_9MICO|nr:dsRBD fold-containing protein [Ornithinimicrobium pekingense]GGK80281.1 hypothetical protein GCM10011509_30980 [Ornithinimicrobium pekingense]
MRARPGDRIVLAARHADDPARDGRVVEARGPDDGPPFVVEWSDGHTGLVYPGPGAVLRVTGRSDIPVEPLAGVPAERAARVREWTVRISIFESDDDTAATAVLLAGAPEQLSASGESHRAAGDEPVPEIGDEVAVARALRHLADILMASAEDDIVARTGQDAHVRRT